MAAEVNWDDMRIFLALAASGSSAAAAKTVGNDATTVSRRLQRLERALGTSLFEHGRAGLMLTDAGHRLLAHAEAMEVEARAIQQEASEGAALSGTIRLSVSEGFGTHFVASRLAGFAAAHPGIAVDLIASTGFLNPSRREADVAVMLARPRGGPLIAAKLTDYRLGVYAARDHLRVTGAIDSVEALRAHRLIGYVPDLIYAPELRYLAEVDGQLEPSLRSSSINAQASLIASGAGCGILPCFIGDALPVLVRVARDVADIKRSFWLVVHRDMRRLARIEAFIGWLRGEVATAQPLLLGTQPVA
jgi:DNA-binding transcriptional LysR family regulator